MAEISDLDKYQRSTRTTAIYPADSQLNIVAYLALGVASEAGEVAGKVKKVLRDDRPCDGLIPKEAKDAILAELGDVLWYVARLADELDENLSAIAQANLFKVVSRHARGTIQGSGDNR